MGNATRVTLQTRAVVPVPWSQQTTHLNPHPIPKTTYPCFASPNTAEGATP